MIIITINHQPSTINHQPSTINHQPSTINDQRSDLGGEFLSEVIDSLARIAEYPDAWQQLGKRTRRCLVHRFPYGIIYQKRNNEILVLAISNLHRKPEYWQSRVPDK